MQRIRAIIKRPDEQYGHVTNISCSLNNLQKTVGGTIETLQIAASTAMIMNEEGKLRPECIPNFFIREANFRDVIFGDVIIVGIDGEGFCDCPISFAVWKDMLKRWGNK